MAAKLRAYKLAEEFGMDRNELVEKASAEGILLKSSMAALESDVVEQLRAKFGVPVKSAAMDEQRVESKGGSTILRRRRRKVVEPPPESVVTEYLKPSASTTECHWKGTAHYYSVVVGGEENRDAAWYYPDPKVAAAEIKNHIAFWRGVDVLNEG